VNRRGKYSCVDPLDPRAAGVCDRGGEVRRRSELQREMRWAGNRLVPTGFLCCPEHLDMPHPQDRVVILGPDPVPVRDPRPMPPASPALPADTLTDDHGAPLLTSDDEALEP
jgi:hypothetical protein